MSSAMVSGLCLLITYFVSFFFSLMTLARTVSKIPSIGGDGSYPSLVPNLSGNAFAIST